MCVCVSVCSSPLRLFFFRFLFSVSFLLFRSPLQTATNVILFKLVQINAHERNDGNDTTEIRSRREREKNQHWSGTHKKKTGEKVYQTIPFHGRTNATVHRTYRRSKWQRSLQIDSFFRILLDAWVPRMQSRPRSIFAQTHLATSMPVICHCGH